MLVVSGDGAIELRQARLHRMTWLRRPTGSRTDVYHLEGTLVSARIPPPGEGGGPL